MTRDSIQQQAVDMFSQGNLLCKIATGVGKGLLIFKCVKDLDVLVVVEKLNQIDNMKNDALKHGFDTSRYTFTHYNSLEKYVGKQFDCIVLDECDRCNERNAKAIKMISCNRFLFTSAEVPKERMDILKSICKFKTLSVSLTQAIKYGILPPLEIRLIPLTPTQPQLDKLKKLEKDIEYYKDKAVVWNPPDWDALTCLRKGGERKKLFNQIKLGSLPFLLQKTKGKRRIFFFGNASDCPKELNLYYSGDPSSKKHLQSFMDESSDTLSAIEQLTRGLNLSKIEVGCLMTLGKSSVNLIQKIGRILRSDEPVLYIPFVKDSNDSKFLFKFLESYGGNVTTL